MFLFRKLRWRNKNKYRDTIEWTRKSKRRFWITYINMTNSSNLMVKPLTLRFEVFILGHKCFWLPCIRIFTSRFPNFDPRKVQNLNNNNNNNNNNNSNNNDNNKNFSETRKCWVDVQQEIVSSHGDRDPL